MPSLTGFLITFCIGVAATLGWQSYGDAARELIASSYPQLGWLTPKPAPNAPNAPDMSALAVPATPSPDQQQLNAMSLDRDTVRQSLDRIATSVATSQEQMTRRIERSIDRLAAGQEQTTRQISDLQTVEQYVLDRISTLPPRSAPTTLSKPVLRSPQAPMVRSDIP